MKNYRLVVLLLVRSLIVIGNFADKWLNNLYWFWLVMTELFSLHYIQTKEFDFLIFKVFGKIAVLVF